MDFKNQFVIPESELNSKVLEAYKKWFNNIYSELVKADNKTQHEFIDKDIIKYYFIGHNILWFHRHICYSKEVVEKVAKDLKATLGKDYDFSVEELMFMVYVAKAFTNVGENWLFIHFAFTLKSKELVDEFSKMKDDPFKLPF